MPNPEYKVPIKEAKNNPTTKAKTWGYKET